MSDRKTILITGCAGFIGSNLAEKVISNGNYIIWIDNFDSYYSREIKEKNISQLVSSSNFKIIEDDIRNQKVMENLISESDIIIHLAARAGVRPSIENPMLYQSVNIEGTNVILEAMRKLNKKKLIFASSSSVYGNNKSCLLYTSPSPRDRTRSRMPSSAWKKKKNKLSKKKIKNKKKKKTTTTHTTATHKTKPQRIHESTQS